jgi:hypothetical protein
MGGFTDGRKYRRLGQQSACRHHCLRRPFSVSWRRKDGNDHFYIDMPEHLEPVALLPIGYPESASRQN